jgi:hypothetical protein
LGPGLEEQCRAGSLSDVAHSMTARPSLG